MWKFIKNLLRRWSCIHVWRREVVTLDLYGNTHILFRCDGCGRMTAWDLKGKEITDPHVTIQLERTTEASHHES